MRSKNSGLPIHYTFVGASETGVRVFYFPLAATDTRNGLVHKHFPRCIPVVQTTLYGIAIEYFFTPRSKDGRYDPNRNYTQRNQSYSPALRIALKCVIRHRYGRHYEGP